MQGGEVLEIGLILGLRVPATVPGQPAWTQPRSPPLPDLVSTDVRVLRYEIEVDMDSIGRCEVTERLLVAFVGRSHGIEREIPTRVSSWLLPTLRVTDISVPGHMWRRLRGNGGVIIRIGDPDVYVSGGREYTIQYRTSPPAIGRKISWNLAGPRWWTDLNGVSWSRSPSCHAYRAGGNRSPGTDTSGSMRHGCIPLCIWLPSVRACTPFSSGTAHIPCPSHANSAPFPFLNRMIGESSNSSPPADCHCPPPHRLPSLSPIAVSSMQAS